MNSSIVPTFKIFTIFPNLFPGTLGVSVSAKSLANSIWNLHVIDIRDFAIDNYKSVDDYPFGGGAGMLMKPDVLGRAIESELKTEINPPLILATSARGFTFDQKIATSMNKILTLQNRSIYIICGRFEGIDERLLEHYGVIEINLGKFVVFGGEAAAMLMIESVVRLISGICGNSGTILEESYAQNTEYENLMEHAQYTHPRIWNERSVPETLTSGHHANIAKFNLNCAKEITKKYTEMSFEDCCAQKI